MLSQQNCIGPALTDAHGFFVLFTLTICPNQQLTNKQSLSKLQKGGGVGGWVQKYIKSDSHML